MKAMYNDTKNYIKVSLTLFKQLQRTTGADYRNLPTALQLDLSKRCSRLNMTAFRLRGFQ